VDFDSLAEELYAHKIGQAQDATARQGTLF